MSRVQASMKQNQVEEDLLSILRERRRRIVIEESGKVY